MSYLVVIKTKDETSARRILALAYKTHGRGFSSRPVAVYRWQDKDESTCAGNCDPSTKRLRGWTRHPKRGWMMHECGGRNPHWRKWFRGLLFDYLGKNLLARDKTPKQFRNPEGW